MKGKLLTRVLLSVVVVGFAYPGFGNPEPLHFIFELQGDVKLKREGWTNYQKAHVGDLLSASDQLQLGTNASASVYCSNLQIWQVPVGKIARVSQGCPSGQATLRQADSQRQPTRSPNDPTIPYILSPRNTSLLNNRPRLQWHPVAGAKGYTVEIRGNGISWMAQVSQSEVVYSGEPLKAGYYQIFVTADNGASSSSDEPIGFTLLGEEEVRSIKAEVERLQQQSLNEEAQTLALALLYRSKNLNEMAIESLEESASKVRQTTSIYLLLGEIYQQVGLNRLAREKYLKALELAKLDENLEGQAIAKTGLGEVDTVLNQLDEARQWYRQAQVCYRNLGDERRVGELQQELDFLAGK